MTPPPRIALTGIGVRLPGGVHGPDRLWDALVTGRDLTGPIPPARWERMLPQLSSDQVPERPWVAGVIDDVDAFDHGFFGVPAHEAARMDPQQRLALEVAVEALADAGIPLTSLAGTATGVWAGVAAPDQAALALRSGAPVRMADLSGLTFSMLANRVSYHLDLRGPSITVDTACSAAGTALHLARRALQSGEVDTAIVIGVNLLRHPGITAGFADAGVLAPDGTCRPFDARGQGYVRGEAALALVLRRTDTATRSRDRVYALVSGSAVNTDGRSPAGLYAPRAAAQRDLLRAAYADADLAPASVDYILAHGTGTAAGDAAEGRALAQVAATARADRLPVGSVKSVFGHAEGASALVGTAAAALAVHHGVLPPVPNHTRLRPSLARLPLRVPTRPEPWPQTSRPRTAGVSAFGLGGSNVHIVLEQAPGTPPAEETAASPAHRLLAVSAPSEVRLRGTAAAWAPVVADADLGATASTAQHRRAHEKVRAAVVVSSAGQAAEALSALAGGHAHPALVGPHTAPEKPGRLVWMFAGHGSQHADMAATCYAALPVFRQALEEARAALAAHLGRQPWRPGEPITGFET
ncbi:polyketide synthase, partial [Thermobifida halotolerans]|uniref:polyketide synthase n=1 Tax=Thermobifida halotolerans TaxID=483545 RepID=UPI000AFD67E1